MYIYGPFSFELQRHVSSMMADDMIAVRPMPYGSTFEAGEQISYLEKHSADVITAHRDHIAVVVNHLVNRGVKQIERVATALYFTVTTDDSLVDEQAVRSAKSNHTSRLPTPGKRWRKLIAGGVSCRR